MGRGPRPTVDEKRQNECENARNARFRARGHAGTSGIDAGSIFENFRFFGSKIKIFKISEPRTRVIFSHFPLATMSCYLELRPRPQVAPMEPMDNN